MLASFQWVARAMGVDHGLAKVVKVGDLVQHCNGGQWGKVLRVIPQGDGTAELEIERIKRPENQWDTGGTGWWATYHIREWAPVYGPCRDSGNEGHRP
jgi:hypothetical protein